MLSVLLFLFKNRGRQICSNYGCISLMGVAVKVTLPNKFLQRGASAATLTKVAFGLDEDLPTKCINCDAH